MAIIALPGPVLSSALVPFVEFPDRDCWPFLIAAIMLHTAYHFMLPICPAIITSVSGACRRQSGKCVR